MGKLKLRTIVLLATLALMSSSMQAKESYFFHAAGATWMYAIGGGSVVGAGALTYAPRYNLAKMSKEASFSVGTYASLALQLGVSSGGESSSMIAFEMPVTFDYNFGYGSTHKSKKDFGGFVGLGYAFNSIQYAGYNALLGSYEAEGRTHGVYANTGLRFLNKKEKSWNVSLYSILGFNKLTVAGLRVLYNFGLD